MAQAGPSAPPASQTDSSLAEAPRQVLQYRSKLLLLLELASDVVVKLQAGLSRHARVLLADDVLQQDVRRGINLVMRRGALHRQRDIDIVGQDDLTIVLAGINDVSRSRLDGLRGLTRLLACLPL